MRRWLPWAAVAARGAAGALLTAAGFLKVRLPAEEFAASLEAYRFLPFSLLLPAARVLPWAELLTGLCLVAGLWLRWTAPAALLLFGSFIAVLGSSLLRGIDLADCGCFGGAWPLSPRTTLVLDSLVVLGLAAVVLDSEARLSLDRKLK